MKWTMIWRANCSVPVSWYNDPMLDEIFSRNFTKLSDAYRQFALEKHACQKCSIYEFYRHVGQSEGNAFDPTFMFVGEALGADEVAQKRPFIGRAGQRLRAELRKHKEFSRNNCLISNVLSCRPLDNKFPKDKEGPYEILDGRRAGHKIKGREVVNFCATNWVRREIALLKPKILVTLGSVALDYMRGDRGITEHRGTWKFLPQFRVWSLATYHPSYILRCENDPDKDYIVSEFEADISKISRTWKSLVENDPRMSMSDEDWAREQALDSAITSGLLQPSPILESSEDTND